jgi:hypothetical protein
MASALDYKSIGSVKRANHCAMGNGVNGERSAFDHCFDRSLRQSRQFSSTLPMMRSKRPLAQDLGAVPIIRSNRNKRLPHQLSS